MESELGSKAMHRDIEHIDGAYTLREQSEVYDGNLIGDSEPLRLETAFLWDEEARHSVIRSVTPDGTVNFIFSDPDKNGAHSRLIR